MGTPKLQSILVRNSMIMDFRWKHRKASNADDMTMKELFAGSSMDSTPSCEDVFVTRSGSKDEAVERWLPDNEIAKASKA